MEHEVLELIEMLYTMVTEAWGVPLGNDRCIVERERVLGILDDIKGQLPTELAEAKRLVSARDEFIGSARREAETIRRTAEEQAKAMVEHEEIVRTAKARSNQLLTDAENKSRELRRAANDYVDDTLRRTEEAVAAALNEVRTSRTNFRAAASRVQPAREGTDTQA